MLTPSRMRYCLPHRDESDGWPDVVHPHHRHAVQQAIGHTRQGALHPFFDRKLEGASDERLAGWTEDHRIAERAEGIQVAQELQIMPRGLAESQARVNQDPVTDDPYRLGPLTRLPPKRLHLLHHVMIARSALHGLREI